MAEPQCRQAALRGRRRAQSFGRRARVPRCRARLWRRRRRSPVSAALLRRLRKSPPSARYWSPRRRPAPPLTTLPLPQKPEAGMRRYLGDSRASWGCGKLRQIVTPDYISASGKNSRAMRSPGPACRGVAAKTTCRACQRTSREISGSRRFRQKRGIAAAGSGFAAVAHRAHAPELERVAIVAAKRRFLGVQSRDVTLGV